MSNILITGFSSFGTVKKNPSETLVNLLKQKYKDGIDTYVFTGKKDIDSNLEKLLENTQPKVIVMFGIASRTPFVRLERVARMPSQVVASEKQFTSTLPLERIYEQLTQKNIEVQYSNDAGTYWCNYVFYKVCKLRAKDKDSQHGFIHIPSLQTYKATYGRELDLSELGSIVTDTLLA